MTLLELDHVEAFYGSTRALSDVSLSVEEGQVAVLLGRNGAGKTATISAITGLAAVRGGTVRLDGREITGEAPQRVATLGVGLVPQGRHVFPSLSVRENLAVCAPPGRAALRRGLDTAYGLFPELQTMEERKALLLSGGQQQMLAIARALMRRPRLLLLDEPSEGLAPAVLLRIGEAVRALCADGLTVLLAEQNLPWALSMGQRVHVVVKGRTVLEASAEDFAADHDAKVRYLGAGADTGQEPIR